MTDSGETRQVAVAAMFHIQGPFDDELVEAVRLALTGLGAADIEVLAAREENPDA
jgi:hypothetical protein